MIFFQKNKILIYALAVVSLLLTGCDRKKEFEMADSGNYPLSSERISSEEKRRVVLLYSAGYNDLYSYLKEDIEDYCSGYLPSMTRSSNVALALTHHLKEEGDYQTPVSPYLIRYYKDMNGEAVRDTLIAYPESSMSSSPEFLCEVLEDVKELFPAQSYGMIVSSHATGWLPVGYYSQKSSGTLFASGHKKYNPSSPFPHRDEVFPEDTVAVKSLIQKRDSSEAYEMDLKEFASCLPYHLEYILFDACLMGGIEVAYELKDKCDLIAFSQTEILAQGFIYEKILERLVGGDESDVEGVCSDYFDFYDKEYTTRAATISLVNCAELDNLAEVCGEIFEDHRQELPLIQGDEVQGYFRNNKHWFYDLRDMLCHLDLSEEETSELDEALDECLIYRKATPSFLSIEINNYCGLSSYLPSMGNTYLDNYYLDLKWNKATGMVE